MAFFPASAVFLLIWIARVIRSPDNGVVVAIATLPFGMFAAVKVAGLSLLVTDLLASLTMAALVLAWVRAGAHVERGVLTAANAFLGFYAVYALISATILVRLFAGEFLVFPMNVSATGIAVSIFFQSTMQPLAPGMSNVAQAGYILLSFGFFVAAAAVFFRRSPALGERGLAIAAGLNILLGVLDLMALDTLLSVIRTADYSLLNQHSFNGFPRVIGGFSEASAFGATSAAFFAYFTMAFLIHRRGAHGALALGNLLCALTSLSSSGFVAVAVAGVVILAHMPVYLGRGMSRGFAHGFVIVVSLCLAAVCLLFLLPGVTKSASNVLDWLIFSKASSESGIERSAWARAGFQAFVETGGLGAGAGSLRANGLAAVLLGSVGLPGTLSFAVFFLLAISGGRRITDPADRRVFHAARATALTLLAALMLSATTPNPTLFLMAVTAMSAAARQRARAMQAAPAHARVHPA